MNKILIFCFIVILVGLGCKKENLNDADLLNTEWILSSIQDTKTDAITNYPGDAKSKISIVFSDTSNDIGFNGVCNGGAGVYTYSAVTGEIKVTDLMTTLVGCKYVEWETYTVQNLYYASKYKINGKNLVIYSNGEYDLFFTKN